MVKEKRVKEYKLMKCKCGKEEEVGKNCTELVCEDCTLKMMGGKIVKNMDEFYAQAEGKIEAGQPVKIIKVKKDKTKVVKVSKIKKGQRIIELLKQNVSDDKIIAAVKCSKIYLLKTKLKYNGGNK